MTSFLIAEWLQASTAFLSTVRGVGVIGPELYELELQSESFTGRVDSEPYTAHSRNKSVFAMVCNAGRSSSLLV
jgi:hypothetical protein